MKIDLNYLKFHHFWYEKNIHNLWTKKNCKKFFDNLFFTHSNSLKNTIGLIRNTKNLSSSEFNHCHLINEEKSRKILKIIEKCHPNLKKWFRSIIWKWIRFTKKFLSIEIDKWISLDIYKKR